MSVSHKTIKKFFLDGEIYDESFIPRMKDQYIAMIRASMQSKGYVIRYDIDPDFTISYNGKTFNFKLSVYGVYVGRKRAEWISGIDKNTIISNTTHQNKLSGYYSPVV